MNRTPGRGWWLPLGIVLGVAAGFLLLPFALLAAVCGCRNTWKSVRLPALLLAAGIVIGGSADAISSARSRRQDPLFPPHGSARLELRFVWEDPALGINGKELPSAPKPQDHDWVRQARLLAGREADLPGARWRPLTGKLTVRFTHDSAPPENVNNADCMEVEGTWSAPEGTVVSATESYRLLPDGRWEPLAPPGGSGWREYLAARKLAGSFAIRKWRALPPEPNWRTRCFAWRDAAMHRVLPVLPSPEAKAMTAAMVFGCRGGLPSRLKKDFIRSGVIHLFTVSGLHVGILAGLLFWLFRWLPFRYRAWILPVLALYVMTTGADAPAVRAFLMVLVLALVRSRLCWINGVQLLLWIGALLLLWSPAQIRDAGFQYTFLVTGFLLLAQDRMRELAGAIGAVDRLVPGRLKTRWSRLALHWRTAPAQALAMAGIAFAAAGALSLFHQGNFFPGSVLLNLALLPILSLNFFFAAIALLLPGLGGAPLNGSLLVMNQLVQWGSDLAAGHGYLQPSGWSVALLLAALALWLAAPQRRWAAAGALFVMGWLGWRIVGPQFLPPTILVASGGSDADVPTILLCRPAEGSAVVVDPAGRNRWIKQSADRFGIGHIEAVILSHPQIGETRLLDQLPLLLPCAEIAVAEEAGNVRSKNWLEIIEKTAVPVRYGQPEKWQNGAWQFQRQQDGYTLRESGYPGRTLTLIRQSDGALGWHSGGQSVRQPRTLRLLAVEQPWREP